MLEEPQAALYAWIARDGRRLAQASQAGRRAPRRRRRRRDHRLLRDRRASRRTARSIWSGWPSAITSCSAATTWTSRSRTWSARSSRQQGKALDRWQQASLVHACRAAKEHLLVGRVARGRPNRDRVARLGAARRRAAHRARARRGDADASSRGSFPAVAGRRATDDSRAVGLTAAGAAVRVGPGGHPPPGGVPRAQAGALGKLEGFARPPATRPASERRGCCTRRRCSSTAA